MVKRWVSLLSRGPGLGLAIKVDIADPEAGAHQGWAWIWGMVRRRVGSATRMVVIRSRHSLDTRGHLGMLYSTRLMRSSTLWKPYLRRCPTLRGGALTRLAGRGEQ